MPRLIPRRPPRVRAVDALARGDLARPALRRGAIAQGIDEVLDAEHPFFRFYRLLP